MKNLVFLSLIALSMAFVSCKKETIVKHSECTEHFVEMYTNHTYDVKFYHNGVQVQAYEPQNFNMTGFTVNSGDSVRLTSIKMSNGLFNNWIKVDGTTVADSSIWVTDADTVTLSYVIP